MKQTQSERARNALLNPVSAPEASAALKEAKEAAAGLEKSVADARKAALDPLADAVAAAEARRTMEAAAFELERVRAQEAALTRRVADLEAKEYAEAQAVEYEAAKAERDHLAKKLAQRYPKLVAEMVELLKDVDASDARIAKSNVGATPETWLASAESLARGLDPMFRGAGGIVPRLKDSRLVSFEGQNTETAAWPVQARLAAHLAA